MAVKMEGSGPIQDNFREEYQQHLLKRRNLGPGLSNRNEEDFCREVDGGKTWRVPRDHCACAKFEVLKESKSKETPG